MLVAENPSGWSHADGRRQIAIIGTLVKTAAMIGSATPIMSTSSLVQRD
jgi:hypothetical protein